MKALVVARRELAAYFFSPISYLVATLFLRRPGLRASGSSSRSSTRARCSTARSCSTSSAAPSSSGCFVMFLAAVITMRLVAEERRSGTLEPLLTAPVGEAEHHRRQVPRRARPSTPRSGLPTLLYCLILRAYSPEGAAPDPGPVAAGYLGTLLVSSSRARARPVALDDDAQPDPRRRASLRDAGDAAARSARSARMVSRAPAAAVFRYVNLFRQMEDFGRGIVDSAPLRLPPDDRRRRALRRHARARRRPRHVAAPPRARRGRARRAHRRRRQLAGRAPLRARRLDARPHLRALRQDAPARARPRARRRRHRLHAADGRRRQRSLRRRARAAPSACAACRRTCTSSTSTSIASPSALKTVGKKYGVSGDDLVDGVISSPRAISRSSSRATSWPTTTTPRAETGRPPPMKAWKGEQALDAALLAVTDERAPDVCFVSGHGEPAIDGFEPDAYGDLAEELRRDHQAPRAITLDRGVPADCDVAVIAGPDRPLPKPDAVELDRLPRARRPPVRARSARTSIRKVTRFVDVGIEELLNRWGASPRNDVVVDEPRLRGSAVAFAVTEGYADHPITARLMHHQTLWSNVREVRAAPKPGVERARDRAHQRRRLGRDQPRHLPRRGRAALRPAGRTSKARCRSPSRAGAPKAPARARASSSSARRSWPSNRVLLAGYNRDLVLSAMAWLEHRRAAHRHRAASARAPAPHARRPRSSRACSRSCVARAAAGRAAARRRRLLGAPLVKRPGQPRGARRRRRRRRRAGLARSAAARRPKSRRASASTSSPIFDRARATELEIERRGVVTRLRHEASGWWLVGPPRRRADDSAVDSLLRVLEYGEVDRRLARRRPVAAAASSGSIRRSTSCASKGTRCASAATIRRTASTSRRDDDPGVLVAEHRLVETADLDPRLWMSMRLTLRDPGRGAKNRLTSGWTLRAAPPAGASRSRWLRAPPTPRPTRRAVARAHARRRRRSAARPPHRRRHHAGARRRARKRASPATPSIAPTGRASPSAPPISTSSTRRPPPSTSGASSRCASTTSSPSTSARSRCVASRAPGASSRRWPRLPAPSTTKSVRAFLEPLLAAEARSFSPAPRRRLDRRRPRDPRPPRHPRRGNRRHRRRRQRRPRQRNRHARARRAAPARYFVLGAVRSPCLHRPPGGCAWTKSGNGSKPDGAGDDRALWFQPRVLWDPAVERAAGGQWAAHRDFELAETAIPNKYKELIGLAVAAHIKCRYCIYFHQQAAIAHGATDEELKEACAMGGLTVQFSNAITGMRYDYEKLPERGRSRHRLHERQLATTHQPTV